MVSSSRCSGLAPCVSRYIEPLPFAFGLAICIVSGVVLLKAIRDYLKEPKN